MKYFRESELQKIITELEQAKRIVDENLKKEGFLNYEKNVSFSSVEKELNKKLNYAISQLGK